jgi:hypothetical protein
MLGHRVNSEGLRGRANAPRRRRTQEDLYRVRPRFLSTFPSTKIRKKAAIIAGFCQLPSGIAGHRRAVRNPCARRQTIGEFGTYPQSTPHCRAVLGDQAVLRAVLGDSGRTLGRTWATFLGRSLCNRRDVAKRGKRQHHLSFSHLGIREPGNYAAGTRDTFRAVARLRLDV